MTSRRWLVGTLGCSILLLIAPTRIARAQRAIPDDNLAYPVLVQLQGSEASGFYLNTPEWVYLVTAKHVLFNNKTGQLLSSQMTLLSYPRNPNEPGRNVFSADLATLMQLGEVTPNPREDVVVVVIAKVETGESGHRQGPRKIRLVSGVRAIQWSSSGILGVGLDGIKDYADVLVANEVMLFGYPTSLGLKGLPQLDPLRPLLRKGIVAGLNPTTRSIIIDCPAYPGNSGGPVLEVDRNGLAAKFDVIGVVSQFVPFAEESINLPLGYTNTTITNSGYTIVVPMDFVTNLIK